MIRDLERQGVLRPGEPMVTSQTNPLMNEDAELIEELKSAYRGQFLTVLSVVIPKEGFAGRALPRGPCQPFFWYDIDYRFVICSLHRSYCNIVVIPKKGLVGRAPPANPSLGTTNTQVGRNYCFINVTELINDIQYECLAECNNTSHAVMFNSSPLCLSVSSRW